MLTGWGGAVAFDVNARDVIIKNSKFTNNTARNGGGAVFFSNNGDVTNCNFTDNSAVSGGAV